MERVVLIVATVIGLLLIGTGIGMLFLPPNARPSQSALTSPIAPRQQTISQSPDKTSTARPEATNKAVIPPVEPTETPQPIVTPHPKATHFSASSVETNFYLVGTVDGSYTIYDDRIEVVIEEGQFHFSGKPIDGTESTFTSLRVGSGFDDKDLGQWNIDSYSDPFAISVKPNADGVYVLRDVTLTISRNTMDQNVPHWLVFELSELSGNRGMLATNYIHNQQLFSLPPSIRFTAEANA